MKGNTRPTGGRADLPFMACRCGVGTSYLELNPQSKVFTDTVERGMLMAVPEIKRDLPSFLRGGHTPEKRLIEAKRLKHRLAIVEWAMEQEIKSPVQQFGLDRQKTIRKR
jgi:hypothetical protein